MNEKIAIEILKQANIETTVGCCEKCPRKDKNKTCIGCLDDAKNILLNYIDNLQSKIDKAIEYLYEHSQYNDGDGIHYIKEDEYCVDYLLDILKEDK